MTAGDLPAARWRVTGVAAPSPPHRARDHIRTAVADLLPDQPERPAPAATAAQPVLVEIPGKVADHLAGLTDLGDAEQQALRRGRTIRRGQGYSLHVTALPEVHRALLAAASLDTDRASSADRKAYRIYADRLNTAPAIVTRELLGGWGHVPKHLAQ